MIKKLAIIIVILVIALGATWFYLRGAKPAPAPSEEISGAPPNLPVGAFNADDNLDQALEDLRALEEAGL